jgi:ubiquitin-activating enzyme E1
MEGKEPVQIDTNLYSRQIGTFGMETMGKLIKMKVLIVGARGLGVEAAKNLILAGPQSVTLYDPVTV